MRWHAQAQRGVCPHRRARRTLGKSPRATNLREQTSGLRMRTSRRLIYAGRVQGVGFRYSVKQIATGFDVTGWVRNLAGRNRGGAGCGAKVRRGGSASLKAVAASHLAGCIKDASRVRMEQALVAGAGTDFEIRVRSGSATECFSFGDARHRRFAQNFDGDCASRFCACNARWSPSRRDEFPRHCHPQPVESFPDSHSSGSASSPCATSRWRSPPARFTACWAPTARARAQR